MKRALLVAPVLVAIFTTGCVVGPNYVKPTATVPDSFKEPMPPEFKEAPGWKQGEPRDDMHGGQWWEIFGDPALNALEEQIDINNQNIAAQEAQLRGARAAIRVARSGLYPTVSGGTSVLGSGSSGSLGRGAASQSALLTFPSVSATWEPDVFGAIRRSIEASTATAQATAADLANLRLLIETEVALDYFQLLGLDAQKKLLDDNVAAYQQAVQLTVNRYNQGVASQVDVAQAQTQLEQTRAESTDTIVARQQFEHAIAVLLGKPPSQFSIPFRPLTALPPPIPGVVPSQILERRPDIAANERRVAAANADIGVAISNYYPTITLGASGGLEGSSLTNLFNWPSRFWSLGPSASQLIWDRGRRRGLLEETEASYDVTVANYRQSVLNAFQNVEDNLAALHYLEEESRQQAAAVTYAERSLQLAQNRYQGGITTYLEVITAQAAALVNERTAVSLQTRRMQASVGLIQALGGGWDVSKMPTAQDVTPQKTPKVARGTK
ncbi:MAG: efflux transporter outer membrane subunit [Acidobacteriia bacterium]|nr:efflux transporter outer membrane subunit [Terriglobia bacterium]